MTKLPGTTLRPLRETRPARQTILDLASEGDSSRAAFVVSSANWEAVTIVDKWPAWPSHALILYGPSGCGKTHIGRFWAQAAGARILNPAELTEDQLPSLLGGNAQFLLDDAGLVAGRREAERALFHIYNAAQAAGGRLLLTGSAPPALWNVQIPDLRSRLAAAPAIAIAAPDDELLSRLLVKLFADRGIAVPPEVVDYLVRRMERSFGAARRIVSMMDERALSLHRPVTVAIAREIMESAQA